MEKKLQAKHIPDVPILEFLVAQNGAWANIFDVSYEGSVRSAMPPDAPFKVALAKMRKLMDRGLVGGCGCGCRGDFVITPEGITYLSTQQNHG